MIGARFRRRVMCAVLLMTACAGDLRAQTPPPSPPAGAIHGRVVDAHTGEAVADVLVIAEDAARRATTDADGRFVLDDVPAGPRTLVLSIVGYALVRRDVVVESARTLEITLPLAAGAGAYTEKPIWRKSLPRTENSARKSSPVATPGIA